MRPHFKQSIMSCLQEDGGSFNHSHTTAPKPTVDFHGGD